jgi:hypothetical protein
MAEKSSSPTPTMMIDIGRLDALMIDLKEINTTLKGSWSYYDL